MTARALAGPPVVGMIDLGLLLLKVLALAGAVVVGAVLAGLVCQLLARAVTRRPLPRPALVLIRVLGGAALGLAVWLWVFGPGGGGFGWGGGFGGLGTGTGKGPGTAATTAPSPTPETAPPPPPPTPPGQPEGETLRVDMLGGQRVQEQRFYVLEGQKEALTLADLRKLLLERKGQKDRPLRGIDIVIYENSVSKDHPAVRDLEKWARDHDLAVSLSFPKQDAPE